MKWTKKDRDELLQYRKVLDNDNTKLKEEIKARLVGNKAIIHVLNNSELEEKDAESDDYFGVNIRPAFVIPETQTNVQNYICYETSFKETSWRNSHTTKEQQIVFYVLCHEKNIIDEETGLARHDLLAALITSEFNYEIFSGGRIRLESDIPSITDSQYVTRTLTFVLSTDADLVKTRNGVTGFVNHKL